VVGGRAYQLDRVCLNMLYPLNLEKSDPRWSLQNAASMALWGLHDRSNALTDAIVLTGKDALVSCHGCALSARSCCSFFHHTLGRMTAQATVSVRRLGLTWPLDMRLRKPGMMLARHNRYEAHSQYC